ncbi:hypothetical protein ACIQ9P_36460 [Kitasatospora sp. NPDC094019]|uniref:hypothetical protein n=1 Tax=Kitasatospora sp. NPDC094019 TaxID=3364091 RepID=UPI003824475B
MARLLTLALSLVLTIGLFAPLGQAAPVTAAPGTVPPAAREAAGAHTAPSGELPPPGVEKVRKSEDPAAVPAEHNGDIASADIEPRNDFAPWAVQQSAAKASGLGAAAGDGSAEAVACNPTDFGRTGADLIRLIKSVDMTCVDSLFLAEGNWAALAATLAQAEAAGHDPTTLLTNAAARRELATVDSPAAVLTWRIRRDAGLPAHALAAIPDELRTCAALFRSTTSRTTVPVVTATAQSERPPIPPVPGVNRRGR